MSQLSAAASAAALTLLLIVTACGGPASAAVKASNSTIHAVNLGSVINTSIREAEPSFTADGHTMYFNCHGLDICVSKLDGTWEEGRWSAPKVVPAPITSPYEDVEPVISPEGDKPYFTSYRPFASGAGMPGLSLYVEALYLIGDSFVDGFGISLFGGLGHDKVWVSKLVNGVWSEPQDLNDVPGEPPIESTFNDHCIVISADGNEVFWTSDRPGGHGGNDIWTMRRIDSKWTQPENLGPQVNSQYGEHHAMLSPDGKHLYITSDRPGGYGGDDIYVTTRGADGKWGPLRDLLPQINSSGNDRCPVPTPDGRIFLFDSDRSSGFGSMDLWWVYATEVPGLLGIGT